jgi:hypothetical protein
MSSSAQFFLINCELNCGKHVENSRRRGSTCPNPQELLEERNNPFGFWGGTVAGGLCRDDVYAVQ